MKLASCVALLCVVVAVSAYPSDSVIYGAKDVAFMNSRIVGGQDASPHAAPYIVTLRWGITAGTTQHFCGGSIIDPNWIVTAAHCTVDIPAFGAFVLIAGRHNIGLATEANQQLRPINRARIWNHPDYLGNVNPHDIALIHVEEPFVFNAFVQPIPLPTAGVVQDSGDVTLHGWGSTSTTTTPILPSILQYVVKPIVAIADCFSLIGDSAPLHTNNICTGPLHGGISACSGDSGGPLTQDGVLVGVVSWGFDPCGQTNAPSVYVRVSAYNDWIASTMLN